MPFTTEPHRQAAAVMGLRQPGRQSGSPFWLIGMIEAGLPLAALDRVAGLVAPRDAEFPHRLVARATLARRRKAVSGLLSHDESARLARVARIWAFAREVWGGDDAARAFLSRPHPMLESCVPLDLAIATDLGARLVEDVLGRLHHGSAA